MSQRARKTHRVRRRKDIDRVFSEGTRARNGIVTLVALPNGLPHARCGVGVSRAHGGAVRRNRLKRLCREAFRLSRPVLPAGWDYVIIPRAGRELTLGELRSSVVALAGRLAERGGERGRRG